jgi:hypothetical protein
MLRAVVWIEICVNATDSSMRRMVIPFGGKVDE